MQSKHRKHAEGVAGVASFPEKRDNPPVVQEVCPRKRERSPRPQTRRRGCTGPGGDSGSRSDHPSGCPAPWHRRERSSDLSRPPCTDAGQDPRALTDDHWPPMAGPGTQGPGRSDGDDACIADVLLAARPTSIPPDGGPGLEPGRRTGLRRRPMAFARRGPPGPRRTRPRPPHQASLTTNGPLATRGTPPASQEDDDGRRGPETNGSPLAKGPGARPPGPHRTGVHLLAGPRVVASSDGDGGRTELDRHPSGCPRLRWSLSWDRADAIAAGSKGSRCASPSLRSRAAIRSIPGVRSIRRW